MTNQDVENLFSYKSYFEKLLGAGDNTGLDDCIERIEEFKKELKKMIEVEQDEEILKELNLIEERLERIIDDNGQITFEYFNNENFEYIINQINKLTDSIPCSDLISSEEVRCENRSSIIEMGKCV